MNKIITQMFGKKKKNIILNHKQNEVKEINNINMLTMKVMCLENALTEKDILIMKLQKELECKYKIIEENTTNIHKLMCYVFNEKKNDKIVMEEKCKGIKQQKDNINECNENLNDSKMLKTNAFRKWLKDVVGLDEYFDLLLNNGFDTFESVKMLTMNELNLIGIHKLGHKMLLLKHIVKLNHGKIMM
eukprot:235073_1